MTKEIFKDRWMSGHELQDLYHMKDLLKRIVVNRDYLARIEAMEFFKPKQETKKEKKELSFSRR